MLLINSWLIISVWYKWLFETVGPSMSSNDKARVCGLWMRVVGRLEDGGRPTQHGVGVLLLQISWCRPSKQYKPYSTIFFVCESVGGTINALTFYTTCSQLLEVLYHRTSCIPERPLGARGGRSGIQLVTYMACEFPQRWGGSRTCKIL